MLPVSQFYSVTPATAGFSRGEPVYFMQTKRQDEMEKYLQEFPEGGGTKEHKSWKEIKNI